MKDNHFLISALALKTILYPCNLDPFITVVLSLSNKSKYKFLWFLKSSPEKHGIQFCKILLLKIKQNSSLVRGNIQCTGKAVVLENLNNTQVAHVEKKEYKRR